MLFKSEKNESDPQHPKNEDDKGRTSGSSSSSSSDSDSEQEDEGEFFLTIPDTLMLTKA